MTQQHLLKKEAAARLKQARENAGYASPQDFCEQKGFALDRYLAQEQGKIAFKSSEALRYCKALQVSLCWLLTGH